MDPVGTPLASIGLFLQVYEVCKRLHEDIKLTRRFGEDFRVTQTQLEAQWLRLEITVTRKRISWNDLQNASNNDRIFNNVKEQLIQMRRLFENAQKITEKYLHGDDTVLRQASTASEQFDTMLSGSKSRTQQQTSLHSPPETVPKARKSFLRSIGLRRATEDEQRMSRATTLIVPSSSRSESLANSSDIEAALESIKEQEQKHQANVGYLKRFGWAKEDRQTLRDAINELRTVNNELDFLLNSISADKGTGACSMMAASPEYMENVAPLTTHWQRILGELHTATRHVNAQSNQREGYFLSIQLQEDHRHTRQSLEDHCTSLLPKSDVFNIQRHCSGDRDDRPELILLETAVCRSDETRMSVSTKLDCLDRPIKEKSLSNHESVELWGFYDQAPDSQQPSTNVVYHDADGQWQKVGTLATYLEDDFFQNKITPSQTVQLARLLICGLLHLQQIFDRSVRVQPSSFAYYANLDTQQLDSKDLLRITWEDEDGPLVLQPWFAMGFGRRAAQSRLGYRTTSQSRKNFQMIEFGLLLFQIGLWTQSNYESGTSGIINAKCDALRQIERLDNRLGATYAELVQEFLSFETVIDSHRTAEVIDKEETFLHNAIATLQELEHELENTAITPRLSGFSKQLEEGLQSGDAIDSSASSAIATVIG